MIDFSPMRSGDVKAIEFAKQFSRKDLRHLSDESIDYLLDLISDLDDSDVTFDPIDPLADDPHAIEGEEKIGWSLAHLTVHVTASMEESAAFSSLLARGVPAEERLRYETHWKSINTLAECVQRLEESRRIRNAYLETWPDEPHLDVFRKLSERFVTKYGEMNAPAAFLFGLSHEVGHYEQFKDVKQQALAAREKQAFS